MKLQVKTQMHHFIFIFIKLLLLKWKLAMTYSKIRINKRYLNLITRESSHKFNCMKQMIEVVLWVHLCISYNWNLFLKIVNETNHWFYYFYHYILEYYFFLKGRNFTLHSISKVLRRGRDITFSAFYSWNCKNKSFT